MDSKNNKIIRNFISNYAKILYDFFIFKTPDPKPAPPASVWPLLSLARMGLSIWVLFAHLYNFGSGMPVPSLNALMAVGCFFAISGYSIHHSISTQPEGYLTRRLWRIMPVHLTSIALALLAYLILGPVLYYGHAEVAVPMPEWSSWLKSFFLLQSLTPAHIDILFPAWSLSIEVIFYFLAPILIRFKVFGISLALVLFSLIFGLIRPFISPIYIGSDSYGLAALGLFWAWGAGWVAYRWRGNFNVWRLLCVTGIVYVAFDKLQSGPWNYLFWIGTMSFMCLSPDIRLPRIFSKICNYLGEISYPLYLVHYPVLFVYYNAIGRVFREYNVASLHLLSVGVATVLLYHFVDRPLRGLAVKR